MGLQVVGFFIFCIGFFLPYHGFQTRHVCVSMQNSLNIACIVCNFSTMLAIQRESNCLNAIYQSVNFPYKIEQFMKLM